MRTTSPQRRRVDRRKFFEEVRANAFMGTFLGRDLTASMRGFATIAGVSGLSAIRFAGVSIRRCCRSDLECIAAAAAISQDHLRIIDRRLRAVDELLTRLARDFGVTEAIYRGPPAALRVPRPGQGRGLMVADSAPDEPPASPLFAQAGE